MMKKSLTFVVLFAMILLKAQISRFSYEYKFIPDSTNVSDVKSEVMNLDVSPEGSKFYSYSTYKSDSLMKVDLEKQLKLTGMINIKSDMKKGNVRYSVSKKYPDYAIFLHTKILKYGYKVKEEGKMNWKILSEKSKIGEWNVQKAETNFGGRKWTAWFSTEIPIPDGPYKFHRLPGLIVKIEDGTKSHIFELKEILNTGLRAIENDIFKVNEIEITQKQYEKVLEDYENNPAKDLSQMGGKDVIFMGANGENIKSTRDREKSMKDRMKKDNNKIELKKNSVK